MKNSILVVLHLYIYFIYFLQPGYPRTINIESVNVPDELIYRFNITTSFNKDNSTIQCDIKSGLHDITFYCKDKICGCLNDEIPLKPFIELPDKNGTIQRYILIPYADRKENYSYKLSNNETVHVSTRCNTDIQCFSNKCIDNACTYNRESNVERCDYIYTKPSIFSRDEEEGYYCGRMVREYCVYDTDCSFKNCKLGRCSLDHYVPSERDLITLGLQKFYLWAGISMILITICCCSCCCFCFVKHRQKIIESR